MSSSKEEKFLAKMRELLPTKKWKDASLSFSSILSNGDFELLLFSEEGKQEECSQMFSELKELITKSNLSVKIEETSRDDSESGFLGIFFVLHF